jgi:hypothetical protein
MLLQSSKTFLGESCGATVASGTAAISQCRPCVRAMSSHTSTKSGHSSLALVVLGSGTDAKATNSLSSDQPGGASFPADLLDPLMLHTTGEEAVLSEVAAEIVYGDGQDWNTSASSSQNGVGKERTYVQESTHRLRADMYGLRASSHSGVTPASTPNISRGLMFFKYRTDSMWSYTSADPKYNQEADGFSENIGLHGGTSKTCGHVPGLSCQWPSAIPHGRSVASLVKLRMGAK